MDYFYPVRSVVYQPQDKGVASEIIERLLIDMGHHVDTTDSHEQAVDLLRADLTDLLIIDGDVPGCSGAARLLDELQPSDLPRQIAVFSSNIDEASHHLRHRVSPERLHVFIKPLHLHGLLNVLKHLQEENRAGAVA